MTTKNTEKYRLLKASDFIAQAELNGYELATDPRSVIEAMIDCLITYCPEYMHGRNKYDYIKAARKCLWEINSNG